MSESEMLAPCPFCGGVDLEIDDGPCGSRVECNGCDSSGPTLGRLAAIAAWNRRSFAPPGWTITHREAEA